MKAKWTKHAKSQGRLCKKQIHAQRRYKIEIQDSLEKQRNELLHNIADSDKADLLKRIETLQLEVQKLSAATGR